MEEKYINFNKLSSIINIFDKKVTQKGTNERRMSWNKGTLGHKCCICLFVAKKQFGFKLSSLTPPVW